ncbi:MAG: VWA domain-containing protein, partial [Patescibacteria group bacterium]|nr:VWA domain-containing protein [Patescibacteria group bacterium]
MYHIALEQGSSVGVMVAVAFGAIVLAGAFYYRAFRALRPGQWQVLLALRALAIVIVVVLLFRPVFSYQRDLEQRPSLVFLVDRSGSMSIGDDATGVTRFNQARRQAEVWGEALRDDFNLHWYAFAEQAQPLDDAIALGGLTPDGQATSLAAALQTAAKAVPARDIEAIILISDGIHNAAGDPRVLASRLGTVVHAVGVGAGLRSDVTYRDIRVVGLDCPERMIRDNLAEVTAVVEAVGLTGRVVRVILEDEDEQVLGEQELTLGPANTGQEVRFEFRPNVIGRRTYTVRVPPAPEERIEENNRRSAVSLVVEPGIRVLYIEGTLRAEYGAIVDRFLAKDPDLEFCALVQTRPNFFLRRGNIPDLAFDAIPVDQETFDQFHVFILGDLDSSFLRPAQQAMLANRVRAG